MLSVCCHLITCALLTCMHDLFHQSIIWPTLLPIWLMLILSFNLVYHDHNFAVPMVVCRCMQLLIACADSFVCHLNLYILWCSQEDDWLGLCVADYKQCLSKSSLAPTAQPLECQAFTYIKSRENIAKKIKGPRMYVICKQVSATTKDLNYA